MEESELKTKQKNLNTAALMVMGFLLFTSAMQLLMYYQMNVLFVKPLYLPDAYSAYIEKIKDVGLLCSIVGGIALVPAGLSYFFKKPIIAIIIAMLALGYIQTRYSVNDAIELQKSTLFNH